MPIGSDITGKTFNYLKAIKPTNERTPHREVLWLCECVCKKRIKVPRGMLTKGSKQSCGCMFAETRRKISKKHGAAASSRKINVQRDYGIWTSIKARCNNPNTKAYKNYGGRGIKICKEWNESFIAFSAYIRTLPSCPKEPELKARKGKRQSLSIDRVNNNKNYEPGNIRWSSSEDQNNNTRSNRIFEFKKDKGSLSKIVKKYAVVSYNTVLDRINKLGWTLEKALLTPRRKQKSY